MRILRLAVAGDIQERRLQEEVKALSVDRVSIGLVQTAFEMLPSKGLDEK